MFWENLRTDEFDEAIEKSKGVCILPIGCLEAHGIHMPLGCDVMHVTEVCNRASLKEYVTIFPPLYFGEKSDGRAFKGTVIFPESLIIDILYNCCNEISRNGFKKILIMSGHGGNTTMLNSFARSIVQRDVDYQVFISGVTVVEPSDILSEIEKYPYLTEEDIKILSSYNANYYGHGCFAETGLLYDVRPDLVRLDLMDKLDGKSTGVFADFSKHKIWSPYIWIANFPNSLCAEYHPGLNERIAKAMGEKSVSIAVDTFKFLKEETVSQNFDKEWRAKYFK